MHINQRSRGSALLVSLVLLTVITIGAMVSMQRSTLQLRMVTNMQHQQQIFNGVYGHLRQLEDEMEENVDDAKAALDPLVIQESKNIANGKPAGQATLDPFATSTVLTPISQPSIVKAVTTVTNVIRLPEPGSKNLKESKGNSQGSVSFYYFGNRSDGTDANNNIRTRQEIGIRLGSAAIN